MTHEQIVKTVKTLGAIAGAAGSLLAGGWKLNNTLKETIRGEVADLRSAVAELPTKTDLEHTKRAAAKAAWLRTYYVDCPAYAVRGKERVKCKAIPAPVEDDEP